MRMHYKTYKASGNTPEMTLDQRRQDRSQALAGVMRDIKSGSLKEDLLPGGKGDYKKLHKFDWKQVEKGLKVEREHTRDPRKAAEIVADHLAENPEYYSILHSAGLADELEPQTESYNTLVADVATIMLG
jgi:hypothetical protein